MSLFLFNFQTVTRLWAPRLATGATGATGAAGATSSSTTCGRLGLPRRTGASTSIGRGSATGSTFSTTAGIAVVAGSSSTRTGASVGARVRGVLAGLVGRALVVRLDGAGVVVVVVVDVVKT